ncbi:MAG: histidine kinase [Sideroxydans sp.]|nr:histidine kinase [Sideroxydans sp.]
MFKLQRFYSWTSFIVIFIAAALLTLFYRQVTMNWIEHLAKTNHQAVATTALNAVNAELTSYLNAVQNQQADPAAIPPRLAEKIHRLTQGTTVDDIDIYDRKGNLLYSTHADTKDASLQPDSSLMAAASGNMDSSMLAHEDFNWGNGVDATGSLIMTHVPIRQSQDAPVIGIFGIQSDMGHVIEESNRVMLQILIGGEFILAVLYAILVFVVRHAKKIIDSQQKTIRDRTASLEILSRRLLESEELRKKKIATDLHEGLAQTLSALKINVESNELKVMAANAPQQPSLVPVLQQAIQEVRSIATELRPSSLDDLGLLPTLNWFCREFEYLHPDIQIQREISLSEGMIPSHLKIEIYRIIETAFKNIAKYSNTDRIQFIMHWADDMIHLVIGDRPSVDLADAGYKQLDQGAEPQFRFAEVKERTSLSGGAFSTSQEREGWVTLRSSWACAAN